MNLPIKFAQRYLFAKRSTNAINIISGITVFGLAVGTAALVIVFGVFNGLGELIRNMSSNFSPDVKVMPAKGKFFVPDAAKLAEIRAIEGVLAVSKTIEEIAFFEYNGKTTFGTLKGVDAEFHQVTAVDSSLWEGEYLLGEPKGNFTLLGKGIRSKLDVNIDDPVSNNLKVYMAKRKESLTKPFRTKLAVPRGIFSIEPEVDQTYVLSSLAFARKLMNYDEEVSFLEIKLKKGSTDSKTVDAIKTVMGDQFLVQDRYQQDEAFNKIMNVEKWTTVAITSLTLLIVAFNLIGALWMVVMDKRKDISILKSMGATDSLVRNIFLSEGLLLSMVGMFSGFILALILYTLQKTIGIVP
ncbi:MAG: FtsX-like permease family protein, partial [Bacteroidota bacterium]